VEVYARALEQIFHLPIRRRVVWFLRTGTGIEIQ
jgi:hypothetical protein